MLEKYKIDFPNFYRQISLAINENRVSHAYLIEVGDYDNYVEIVNSIVIDILSSNDDKNDYKKLITNNRYPDFLIISPNNSRWIKKEQILNLQVTYKTKSVYNNKKIYVIDKADDLNLSAANTLLKFLEEPNDDIVAILISRNKYNVIPTIVSRCQLISLDRVNNIKSIDIQNFVVDFLFLLNDKGLRSIPYLKKFDYDFESKDNLTKLVEEIIKFYQDLYRYILKKDLSYYYDYKEQMQEYIKNMTISTITKKLIDIEKLYNKLQFNINNRLIMDKLIIILVGVDMDV